MYFTIYTFGNFYFYFTTFPKEKNALLINTFSLTPKSTGYILQENGPIHTLINRTSLVIPTASDQAGSLLLKYDNLVLFPPLLLISK